jgi:hypothetical protein
MATGQGTATIDFGAFPGTSEASIAVTGQASILGTSKAEAYIMGDDTTADHDAGDHRYAAGQIAFTCGTPVAATGFTIYGRSVNDDTLEGTFALRWVWAD